MEHNNERKKAPCANSGSPQENDALPEDGVSECIRVFVAQGLHVSNFVFNLLRFSSDRGPKMYTVNRKTGRVQPY